MSLDAWKDLFFWTTVAAGIYVLIGTAMSSYLQGRIDSRQRQEDQTRIGTALAEGKASASQENQRLFQEMTTIRSKLDPFISIAAERYPGLKSEEEALTKLRAEIASNRQDIEVLSEKTAPRTFASAVEEVLVRSLTDAPKSPIIVSSFMFDPECGEFGDRLTAILKHAGWSVSRNKTSLYDFKGVHVVNVTTKTVPLPGYEELTSALSTAGVNLQPVAMRTGGMGGGSPDGTLLVIVGRR